MLFYFIYIIFYIFGVIIGKLLFKNYIYHGPNSKNYINKIYKYNKKYYKLEPKICICPII